jgi:hypothetical protein
MLAVKWLSRLRAGFSATCGHTQLPGRRVANVGSLCYLSGNTTSERIEAATAHTAGRLAHI